MAVNAALAAPSGPRFVRKPDAWREYFQAKIRPKNDWKEFSTTIQEDNVRQQALVVALSKLVLEFAIGGYDLLYDMVVLEGSFFYDSGIVITESNLGTFATVLITYLKNSMEIVRGTTKTLGGTRYVRPAENIADAPRSFEVAHNTEEVETPGQLEFGITNFVKHGSIEIPVGVSGAPWVENTNGVKLKIREDARIQGRSYVTLGPRLVETTNDSDRTLHRATFDSLGPELLTVDLVIPSETIKAFIEATIQMLVSFAKDKKVFKDSKAAYRAPRAPRDPSKQKTPPTPLDQVKSQLLGLLRGIKSARDGMLGKLNSRISKGTQTITGVIQSNATNQRSRRQGGSSNNSASFLMKGANGGIKRIWTAYQQEKDKTPAQLASIAIMRQNIFSSIAKMERGASTSEIASYKRALSGLARRLTEPESMKAITEEQLAEEMIQYHKYAAAIGLRASNSIYNYSITPHYLCLVPLLEWGYYEPWSTKTALERVFALTMGIILWQAGKYFTDSVRYQTPHEITRKYITGFIGNRPTPGVIQVAMGYHGDANYDDRPSYNTTAAWPRIYGQLEQHTRTRLVCQSPFFFPIRAMPRPNTVTLRNENTGASVCQMGIPGFGISGPVMNPNRFVTKAMYGEELLKKLVLMVESKMGLIYSSVWDCFTPEGTITTKSGLYVPGYNYDQMGLLSQIDLVLTDGVGCVRCPRLPGWRAEAEKFSQELMSINQGKGGLNHFQKFLIQDFIPDQIVKQESEVAYLAQFRIVDWSQTMHSHYPSNELFERYEKQRDYDWGKYIIDRDVPVWFKQEYVNMSGVDSTMVDINSDPESGDEALESVSVAGRRRPV